MIIDRFRRQIKTRKLPEAERHHTMTKVSFHQEDTNILNVCAPKEHKLILCEQNPDSRNRKFVLMSR